MKSHDKLFINSSYKLDHDWLWLYGLKAAIFSPYTFARYFNAVWFQDHNQLHKIKRTEHVAYIELSRGYQLSTYSLERQPKVYFVRRYFHVHFFRPTLHAYVFVFVQDWASVNNLILFHYLLFNLIPVLAIVGWVNNILQFSVIVYLKARNLLFVDPYVDGLYLLYKICRHVLIA